MPDVAAAKWLSVEGRVDFVSRAGRGVGFELRSQTDSIWVMVADSEDIDPNRLLNARVRVTGVGRAVIASNRNPVLGELSVATADDLADALENHYSADGLFVLMNGESLKTAQVAEIYTAL